jgi:hypothetical protein
MEHWWMMNCWWNLYDFIGEYCEYMWILTFLRSKCCILIIA